MKRLWIGLIVIAALAFAWWWKSNSDCPGCSVEKREFLAQVKNKAKEYRDATDLAAKFESADAINQLNQPEMLRKFEIAKLSDDATAAAADLAQAAELMKVGRRKTVEFARSLKPEEIASAAQPDSLAARTGVWIDEANDRTCSAASYKKLRTAFSVAQLRAAANAIQGEPSMNAGLLKLAESKHAPGEATEYLKVVSKQASAAPAVKADEDTVKAIKLAPDCFSSPETLSLNSRLDSEKH